MVATVSVVAASGCVSGVVALMMFCFASGWAFFDIAYGFYGEFDPGSGRTLAACLTHASRTERPQLAGVLEWRTGE